MLGVFVILGVLLYDAKKIEETAKFPDEELVDAQREMILDPFDENVIREAKKNGIADSTIEAAQKSPVYKFVERVGSCITSSYRV